LNRESKPGPYHYTIQIQVSEQLKISLEVLVRETTSTADSFCAIFTSEANDFTLGSHDFISKSRAMRAMMKYSFVHIIPVRGFIFI
jgi:hypothetical protein